MRQRAAVVGLDADGDGAAGWMLAPTLATLLVELDTAWPLRARGSDGTIGDAAHRARQSDHNPNERGYVRAIDITHDIHRGPPLGALAELFRQMGERQSTRLVPGGYVIWNRRSASAASRWVWTTYLGENPHVDHLHLSVSSVARGYLSTALWHVNRLMPHLF